MGIIKKISSWLGTSNSVEVRGKIKKATLSVLHELYLSNAESCKTKRLAVWLNTDKTTFSSFSDFGQELQDYWETEGGYVFEEVVLKYGKPGKELDARKADADTDAVEVYLQEQTEIPINDSVARRARVYVFGGKGQLLKEQVELSAEELEKEGRKFYNIGRGEFPELGAGSYRQNHIAIDDVNSQEINRFVSRAHAKIGFSDSIGFYLQVENGGSRLSGNRTRIFRDERTIELESTEVKEPLHNGDLIELGKAVVLKYVEINP